MANVATWAVRVLGDTRGFDTSMRKSTKNAKGFQSTMKAASGVVTGFAATLLTSATALLSMKGFEQGDELAKTADRIGVAAEDLQGLHFAAGLAGVSVEETNKAMVKFGRNLADAVDGNGEALESFKKLEGLGAPPVEELAEMKLDKAVESLSSSFKELGTDAERVQVASEIFGGRGVKFVNFLDSNIRAANVEFRKMGTAMSREELRSFEMVVDDVHRFKTQLTGLGAKILVEFSGPISEAAKGAATLLDFLKEVRKFSSGAESETKSGFKRVFSRSRKPAGGQFTNIAGSLLRDQNLKSQSKAAQLKQGIRESNRSAGRPEFQDAFFDRMMTRFFGVKPILIQPSTEP